MQPALKQNPRLKASLDEAVQHYHAGAYEMAETLCSAILKVDRRYFDAQNFLGDIYLRQDNLPSARKAFLAALKIHPKSAIALSNLGVVSERLNQTHRAKNAYEKAIKAQPDFAVAYVNLARTLNTLGKVDQAMAMVSTALELAPDNVGARILRGTLHLEANRSSASLEDFYPAFEQRPKSITLLRKMAHAYYNLALFHDALTFTNLALNISPDAAELIYQKASVLFELGLLEEALIWFERYPVPTNSIGPYLRRAECLQALRRHSDALALLTQLQANHSTHAEIDVAIGTLYLDLGQRKEAVTHFEQALQKDATNSDAYRYLAEVEKFSLDDPLFDRITDVLTINEIDNEPKSQLHFALSKGYDDVGDFDRAFDHLTQAHDYRKLCSDPYDPNASETNFKIIRQIVETLEDAHIEPTQPSTPTPILIVGLPRSGTTLTEQILSSHTEVFGAGELPQLQLHCSPFIRNFARQGLDENLAHLANIGHDYSQYLASISHHSPYIVDKMPANFRFVAILLSVMPHAKIIDMRRDPRAVCWSIYKQNFNLLGHRYADDFDTLAHYYRFYLNCMALAKSHFPDRIFELDYAALTEDQDTVTRQLLEFCGLDWQDACLDFHRNERAVATVSNLQVRKKMYTGSSDAWRKYERHLEPLNAALKRHGVALPD